jgi:hypothetical protein
VRKREDKETRYFVDLDLGTQSVLGWDYDQRRRIVMQDPENPTHHRIFITKGQYNKLEKKNGEING